MTIYPAIDLYEGKAVRLKRGIYTQMTVYNDDPVMVARGFKEAGAEFAHIIDLEGARDGKPANFEVIKQITEQSGLSIQVGGGVRTTEIINKYLAIGVRRVVLGTAAISTPGFLQKSAAEYGDKISVSADIRDGLIAIKGWTELSEHSMSEFAKTVEAIGIKTLICTDISKDGLLEGTNMELYRRLRAELTMELIASGGISTIDEIKALNALGMGGAILGKALYTGVIDLREAILAAADSGAL